MLSFCIGEFLSPGCFSGTHACVEFRNIQHTGGKREALGNPSGNRVGKIVRKVYGYANQVSYITGAALSFACCEGRVSHVAPDEC